MELLPPDIGITRKQALVLLKGFIKPIPDEYHEEIASACEANQTSVVHEIHSLAVRHGKKGPCPCYHCT